MKKVYILLLVLLVASGCSSKMKYNSQYGVRYVAENGKSAITIRLDERKNDTITDLWIVSSCATTMLKKTDESWNTDTNNIENAPISYCINDNGDGTYTETIVLRLYREDFDARSASLLLDYLGLSNEFKDSRIKYKEELLKSDLFIYQDMLVNGEYQSNISLNGDPQFDYKG